MSATRIQIAVSTCVPTPLVHTHVPVELATPSPAMDTPASVSSWVTCALSCAI